MKRIIFVFLIFASFLFITAQTRIILLDEETKTPIKNSKTTINNNVFYSNEDGMVIIPAELSNSTVTINIPFYENLKIEKLSFSDTDFFLKPTYKKIEEVIITKFDFNDFIKNLYENYNKYYNIDTYLYNALYKDKLLISNKINSLLITDINLWTIKNAVGMNLTGNIDKYTHISLGKMKYYKVDNSEINFNKFSNQRATSWFNARMFLNGEFAILQFGLNKIPVKTQTIYQDENFKKMSFQSETMAKRGTTFTGSFVIDKENGAISHMEVEQTYSESERIYKSDGNKFVIDTNSVTTIYDLHKKDGRYFPSKFTLTQKGILTPKNGSGKSFSRTREIEFKNGVKTSETGLKNKIDISNKDILSYIPTDEIKDTKTLLSAEEQKFVDEP